MGRPRRLSEFKRTELGYEIICKDCNFLIDFEDYNKVKDFTWFSKKSQHTGAYYAYAHCKDNTPKILLHRYILDVSDRNVLVDHKNGNTLDNRRCNIRIASRLENNRNAKKRKNCKSEYKGLGLTPEGRWVVAINVYGKRVSGGRFDNEIEAAKMYNMLALKYFGPYARLNIIKGENNE